MAALAMVGLTTTGAVAEDSTPVTDPRTLERTIKQLIDRLGHDRFDVREAASRRLLEIGEPAIPALDTAAKSVDAEIRTRGARILAILSRQSAIQCAYNDASLNYRAPADKRDRKTLVKDLFIHERQRTRWKVTRTDKGHLIQVTSGPCRSWYFEFDDDTKPFLDNGIKVARCLRLNKELTKRAYWKLTRQEERNAFFIQPPLGKFKNWYLDIDEPRGKLLLTSEVVPGAYWRIGAS